MAETTLVEEALTYSVIGAFFEVYNTLGFVEVTSTHELRKEEVRRVYSYLHATKLELALLLHFGPEAKFYRLISPNKKRSAESPRSAESA